MLNRKPISDLCNYNEHLRDASVGEAVFLVKNGRRNHIILDIVRVISLLLLTVLLSVLFVSCRGSEESSDSSDPYETTQAETTRDSEGSTSEGAEIDRSSEESSDISDPYETTQAEPPAESEESTSAGTEIDRSSEESSDISDPYETTQAETTTNSEGSTSAGPEADTEHVHSFSDWTDTKAVTCLGERILSRCCTSCGATEESYEVVQNTGGIVSLDKKTVAFIGNSFIYYGNCVINGGQGSTDTGYFYQLARENGESVTVYDYVYGGRNLEYIYNNALKPRAPSAFLDVDYVFLSEAGENNSEITRDILNIMSLFPEKTQFFYLCHSYTYYNNHSNIINAFPRMKELGVSIVNWGELVYCVSNGEDTVPGATESYNKETFIKNNSGTTNGSGVVGAGSSGDAHHPNPLSGYLTALMAYTAVTGRSAVGQPYAFCDDSSIHKYFDLDSFEAAHYNGSKTTNFTRVFASPSDMRGLQRLVDDYNERYGAFSGSLGVVGDHIYGDEGQLLHAGSSNTNGWKAMICTRCGHQKIVEIQGSNTARKNNFLIPEDEVREAGYSSVKEYMLSGKSKIVYQATAGWGRIGFSSIQGMASLCDGSRTARSVTDGSVLYWKIKDRSAGYHADGTAGGKYCALIGYELNTQITANGLSLFVLHDGSLGAYDILGGKKNADGSIAWTVLATCNGTDSEYIPYDSSTDVFSAEFDFTTFDCLEIGVIEARSDILYMSELEIYGEASE